MKIILTKDIKKQGKSGDIINVKDGYGVFLINNCSAIPATQNNINKVSKEKEKKQSDEINLILECKKLKDKLEKLEIKFKVKTGDKGKVFGSISPKQIVEELKQNGYSIDKKQIKITNNISTLGFHNVEVELHKNVKANVKIELIK